MRGWGVFFVMPAKAGIQFTRYPIFWIPAFAGMTVCIAENSPTAQVIYNPNIEQGQLWPCFLFSSTEEIWISNDFAISPTSLSPTMISTFSPEMLYLKLAMG
jgi:hypothetical protein